MLRAPFRVKISQFSGDKISGGVKLPEGKEFDFNGLFIFEVANNHQGSVAHGHRTIREIGRVAKAAGVRGAVKLQFRDLDTFIHPSYRESRENKHPYKMWKISADGRWLEPFLSTEVTGFAAPHDLPRQLFPKADIQTGAMDVIRLRNLRDLKSTSGKKLAYFYGR